MKSIQEFRIESEGLSAWLSAGGIAKAIGQTPDGILKIGKLRLDKYGIWCFGSRKLYWQNLKADKLEFVERILTKKNLIYAKKCKCSHCGYSACEGFFTSMCCPVCRHIKKEYYHEEVI